MPNETFPQNNAPEPENPLGNGFYWEYKDRSNGMGGYRTSDVYLLKTDDPDFRRHIVNRYGDILNFPGYADNKWRQALEFAFDDAVVYFVFHIYPFKNGKARVRWLVQPDGRYFADDEGFGAEHCDRIEMYSELDEDGQFTKPFSVE